MVNPFNQSSIDRFMDSLTEIKLPRKQPPAEVLNINDPTAVDSAFDTIVEPEADNQPGTLPVQMPVCSDQSTVDYAFTSTPSLVASEHSREASVNHTTATSHETPGVQFHAPALPVAQPVEMEYLELVVRAFLAHGRPILVADIYQWISDNVPSKTAIRSWKNSVRHVLTTMCYFYKESHSSYGKASYWWVHAKYLKAFELGCFKKCDIEAFVGKSARSSRHTSSVRHHPYMTSTPLEMQHKQRRHSQRKTTDRAPSSMPNTSCGQVPSRQHQLSPSANSLLGHIHSNPWGYNIGLDSQAFSSSPSPGQSPDPCQMQHHVPQNTLCLQQALHNLQQISNGQAGATEL